MMKRALLFVLAFGLVGSTLTASEVGGDRGRGRRPKTTRDTNKRAVNSGQAEAAAHRVFDHVMAQADVAAAVSQAAGLPGDLCAIGAIPGPAGSFDIRLSILNIGGANIDFATIDSFLALGGNSLIQSDVFATSAGVTVEYPSVPGTGVGPAVLSFTDFSVGAAFNLDPDTYDDPSFGATVFQMNRTVIEVAFSGGRRCRGVLAFNAGLNASIALITQTSP